MRLADLVDLRKEGRNIALMAVLFTAVGVSSFLLGRYSSGAFSSQRGGITVYPNEAQAAAAHAISGTTGKGGAVGASPDAIAGGVVASKSGTKYHFPWCAGAKSIKESNKIWFANAEEARKKGYTPASNCKGLQ